MKMQDLNESSSDGSSDEGERWQAHQRTTLQESASAVSGEDSDNDSDDDDDASDEEEEDDDFAELPQKKPMSKKAPPPSAGKPERTPPADSELQQAVRAMYDGGLSLNSAVREMGVSRSELSLWLNGDASSNFWTNKVQHAVSEWLSKLKEPEPPQPQPARPPQPPPQPAQPAQSAQPAQLPQPPQSLKSLVPHFVHGRCIDLDDPVSKAAMALLRDRFGKSDHTLIGRLFGRSKGLPMCYMRGSVLPDQQLQQFECVGMYLDHVCVAVCCFRPIVHSRERTAVRRQRTSSSTKPFMELTLLAVKREYERLGIGTMMLTFVQQQAHKASATLLVGALHHETPHHSLYC